MYIKAIKCIPMFISRYLNNDKISIDSVKEFDEILLNSEYYFYDKNKYATELKYKPALIDFYKKYSQVDRYGNCLYENDLDLPKSIYYEIYSLRVISGEIKFVSIDFDEDELLLILTFEEDLL